MNTTLTDDQPFQPKAYYVSDLAQLYNPHLSTQAATRQLKRWIDHHPCLAQELRQMGHIPGKRIFTPKQVSCIVEHLGEP